VCIGAALQVNIGTGTAVIAAGVVLGAQSLWQKIIGWVSLVAAETDMVVGAYVGVPACAGVLVDTTCQSGQQVIAILELINMGLDWNLIISGSMLQFICSFVQC
jgi:hypothetical protein